MARMDPPRDGKGELMYRFLAVVLVAIALGSGTAYGRVAFGGPLCGMDFIYEGGVDQCFKPAHVAAAEARIPVSTVRPTASVWRAVHLRLNQVALRHRDDPIRIEYLYGRIPRDIRGHAALVLSPPFYVLVSETVGRLPKDGLGVFNQGYWIFNGNFRCHRLALVVESNEPKTVIRYLGRSILGSETCGK